MSKYFCHGCGGYQPACKAEDGLRLVSHRSLDSNAECEGSGSLVVVEATGLNGPVVRGRLAEFRMGR